MFLLSNVCRNFSLNESWQWFPMDSSATQAVDKQQDTSATQVVAGGEETPFNGGVEHGNIPVELQDI